MTGVTDAATRSLARKANPNGDGLPRWRRFDGGARTPYVQSLAPRRIGAVDYATEHQLDFWSAVGG